MSRLERRLARALVVITVAMITAGCTEPIKSTRPKTPVDAPLAVRLEPADPAASVGAIVRVALMMRGTSANDVASFTARIAYDPTKLRYVDEVAIGDNATRVINPQQYGLLRVAGIAPAGFPDGTLLLVRFTVLQQGALGSLGLTVDEMHTAANADVRASLRASDR